jgi:general secretion pathway protein F
MAYKIIFQENGKIVSKKIEKLDFENLPKNMIEIKELKTISLSNNNLFEKLTIKDLKKLFYELSLMLNSKIVLDEALDILLKKEKKELTKKFIKVIKNSFTNSLDIYTSLKEFKIPNLVKSFFKITQDSGNITENISSLSKIINEEYDMKKEFKKALFYPAILMITFLFSLIGIFKFVVPKFQFMFEQNSFEMTMATKSLVLVKDIFENYSFFILIFCLVGYFFLIYLYKKTNFLKYKIDKTLVKNIPILSPLYRYKTFYVYFLIIEVLLKSKYEFHESLLKAKILINNKYLLDKIIQLDSLLKSGKSVGYAFEAVDIFDDITLSLIKTGEITNSLDITINEIKNINKKRFDESLKLFSLLIEPIFFLMITALIVWIILAVFVPLWSMGDMLKL